MVLGASLSGPVAAARAKEVDPKAKVTLIGRAKEVSYAPGGLPYRLSGEVQSVGALETAKATYFRDLYGIDVRANTSVLRIDPDKKRVHTDDGQKLPYDALVYALGARVTWPHLPGADGSGTQGPALREASNVSTLRDLADLRKLEKIVDTKKRVVILGGGFYGVEAADCLRRAGAPVTLIEIGVPLGQHTKWYANRAVTELLRIGVDVRARTAVRSVTFAGRGKRKRVTELQLTDARIDPRKPPKDGFPIVDTIEDVGAVIVCTGVAPRSELLAEHGVELMRNGAIKINHLAETSIPGIYATSIAAAHNHAKTGRRRWTAQAADADKSAQVAGENAAGGHATMLPTLGTTLVRIGELTFGSSGDWDNGPRTDMLIRAPSRDPYFPGSAPLSILCSCDPSRRIRYVEVIGADGVDKRLDVLATAMHFQVRVEMLESLDLGYTPPHSAVRDPVHILGRMHRLQFRTMKQQMGPKGLVGNLEEFEDDRYTLMIDVRTKAARKALPCPFRAEQIPLSELPKHKKRLRRREVVFVCDTGREAYLAAAYASKHGTKHAWYLMGGLEEYEATRGMLLL